MKITVAGRAAPSVMTPGQYVAKCINSELRVQKKSFVLLTFVVSDGAFKDTLLRCWLSVSEKMSPHGKYVRAWETAAGRSVGPDEDLSPSVFHGKSFRVGVGYRTNGPDKQFSAENAQMRKDNQDFLRVHKIIERIDDRDNDCDHDYDHANDHDYRSHGHQYQYQHMGGGGGEGLSTNTRTDTTPAPELDGTRDTRERGTRAGEKSPVCENIDVRKVLQIFPGAKVQRRHGE
jgi:hypothetical protein